LFIPIFTFVFGEAQLGGRAALVSVRRLRQEFYGLAPDKAMLYARAEKEVLHELGHTLGLVHCRSFECVMRFSNSIEEVDLKSSDFCESCGALARKALFARD
jgi:archaemetzincin